MYIRKLVTLAVATVAGGVLAVAAAGTSKGTASYASKKGPVTVTFTHAALVTGPGFDKKPIRKIVLSTKDVAPALAQCDEMMMCSDGGITEGMTLDLDGGPRLMYWFVANGQLVQYSGTADPTALVLTTDTAKHMAGTLTLDATGAGGPKVAVTFDAPLAKALSK